jgi:hypothetical protein
MIRPVGATAAVTTAALNNAEWCDVVCRTNGIVGVFEADVWASPSRTPPYFPDAVTLESNVADERILKLVDTTPGCSVKDSFASLDLSPAGFHILFEAEWISRSTAPPAHPSRVAIDWLPILTARELEAWESVWSGGRPTDRVFLPALLAHHSVAVLGGYLDGRLVAGFVLNQTRDVVGVSNLFTTAGEIADAWSAVSRRWLGSRRHARSSATNRASPWQRPRSRASSRSGRSACGSRSVPTDAG